MGPLTGFRVVEVTVFQHGPAAAMYLADMGAEVVKVEDPLRGDPGRGVVSMLDATMSDPATGVNYYFEAHNRSKRGIAVNLKTDKGREITYRLVARSDVFLSNYLQTTLHSLGLDYATLCQHNPKIVYARASGYGPRGEDRDQPCFDLAAQARGGLMSIVAPGGEPPLDGGVGTVDQVGGLTLALGVLAALLARERQGIGQEVNSSLLGSAVTMEPMWVQSHLFSGHVPRKPPRSRAKSPFWNTYQAQDGKWFVVAMARSDESWPGLCQALGQPQLENDPRFDTHARRLENSQELVRLFDRVFATRSREEWLRRLEGAGLIVAPVNTYAEVANDPQVRENDYIAPLEHPILGPSLMVGFPIRFGVTPVEVGPTAPQLGQHTEEVLLDICGYSWDEIAEMKTTGVII